jgi:recombination protein RecR
MLGYIPKPLSDITEQFARLPGIGVKSAQRLAYYMLTLSAADVRKFSDTIIAARESVRLCGICYNFCESEICPVCSDKSRDRSTICVVDTPKDVTAFERSRAFGGVYHVLHGLVSPMNKVSPSDIRLSELESRIKNGNVKELILATPPTMDGEATASYINRIAKKYNVAAARLAYGLPVGGSLEYADDVTLSKAIENRIEY